MALLDGVVGNATGNAVGVALALASLVVVVRVGGAQRRAWEELAGAAGPPRAAGARLGLYELIVLTSCSAAPGRMIITALARMHADGRLRVVPEEYHRFRVDVLDPQPQDGPEAALLDLLARTGGVVQDSGDPGSADDRLAAVRRGLVLDGLVCDPGLPVGVPADSPAVGRWRVRHRRLDGRKTGLTAVLLTAGVTVAVVFGSWLPVVAHALVLVVAFLSEGSDRPPPWWCNGTPSGRAAVEAAEGDGWLTATDTALLRRVALEGLARMPEGHPLRPLLPPAPPRRGEPDPPAVTPVNLDPPGLGGL